MKSFFTYLRNLYQFLINQGIDKDTSIREASRIRLSNGLAFFLIINILTGLWIGDKWDTTALIVMYGSACLHLFSVFVNHLKKHQLAKLIVIIVANAITFYFSYREKGVDIHLFLIPVSFLGFILFARRNKKYIYTTLLISFILLLFKLFEPIDFSEYAVVSISTDLEFSKKFVQIELFLVCIFFVYFMFWEGKRTASVLAQEIIRKEKSEDELERYYHANLHLSQSEEIRSGDLEVALLEIAKIAGQAMQVERVNIWKYHTEEQKIECIAHYDQTGTSNIKGAVIQQSDVPIYFRYLQQEDLIISPDARLDDATKEFTNNYLIINNIYSLLDIPIKIEGKMQGIVCFEQTGQIRQWTVNEKEFGLNISSTIALAMEAAHRKQINLKLQDTLASQQALLGIVAHDLKNPISGAISACDVMKIMTEDIENEDLRTELQSYLQLIAQSQKHGLGIINDLLETVNLESTKEAFDLERIELNTAIHPIINLLEGNANKKNIKISHNFYQEDLYVLANASQLTRVIENLITNAIKYTHLNGEIKINLKQDNDYQLISVQDNGIGIPKDLQPFIFDKFSKAKRKGTQNEASTGLGMFISKQIVEVHHGQIWAESEEEQGSIFYVRLPALIE